MRKLDSYHGYTWEAKQWGVIHVVVSDEAKEEVAAAAARRAVLL